MFGRYGAFVVMTPCISPLWTKTGVLQKLPANGLHISQVTHTP